MRRVVIAHLGNGASMCAVKDGRSVATTMGFTAVDGLMMGTRCGAIDPGVILYMMQEHGMDAAAIEDLIYRQSGLLGVSGVSSDMRALRASSDPAAREAIALFVYRIVRELGSLVAALGGIDALVFSAGIGEHDAMTRAEVVERFPLDRRGSRSGAQCSRRPPDQRGRLASFRSGPSRPTRSGSLRAIRRRFWREATAVRALSGSRSDRRPEAVAPLKRFAFEADPSSAGARFRTKSNILLPIASMHSIIQKISASAYCVIPTALLPDSDGGLFDAVLLIYWGGAEDSRHAGSSEIARGLFGCCSFGAWPSVRKTQTISRRLLSLAAIRDGMDRGEAAKIGGMDRQTLRDWVHRFNAEGSGRPV